MAWPRWRRRDVLAGGVFAIAMCALAGCELFFERWSWNQKLTVEVLVDGRIVSGSAVSNVVWRPDKVLDLYKGEYRGEATVVDLGSRGLLFALIGEGTLQIAAYTLHEELGERRADYETLFPKIERFRGVRDVPRDRYPLLVTFEDINDPASVKRVAPGDLVDAFGPGVSLRRMTLEITDEKVTEDNIDKILSWLGQSTGTRLGRSPNAFSPIFATTLTHGNFVRR